VSTADGSDTSLFSWVLSEPASALYIKLLGNDNEPLDLLLANGCRDALKELEDKGFVRVSAGESRRVIPLPPEVPVVRHFSARTAAWLLAAPDLESVENDLHQISTLVGTRVPLPNATASDSINSQVRELPSRTERGFVANSMMTSAKSELRIVQSSKVGDPDEPANIEVAPTDLLERGVTMRFLYDTRVLEDAEFLAAALDEVDLGAEARVIPELATDFLVADHTCALVTTSFAPRNALYTESVEMVGLLTETFEMMWRQARPIGLRTWSDTMSELTDGHRLVLSLAINGLNNEAIARTLKVNPRTVRRRLDDLSDAYGVTNRNALIAAAVSA
jgi:sugar-specific transcriptional regulator TrmB/DNA-binding CsgD family transcriptional regulator